MSSGLGLNINEFASNNCFFTLDLSPEQCNHSHLHGQLRRKKNILKYTLLKNFCSFIDSKTGVIGIDIKFAEALAEDFQLLAYATYPKAAVIDSTGACQLVDNV